MNEEALREPEASHKAPPCFGSLTEEGTYFGGGYVAYGSETFPRRWSIRERPWFQ